MTLTPPPGRMPRLVAIDMDGTLLRSDHSLSPGVIAAVGRARAAGMEVVLASSRPPAGILPYLEALGLRSGGIFVACQGAVIASASADAVRELRAMLLPREAALRTVSVAERLGLATNWYADTRWWVDRVSDAVEREAEILGIAPTLVDGFADCPDPTKLLVISEDRAGAEHLIEALGSDLDVVTSNPTYVEVTARGVDKARAVAETAGLLSIGMEHVAAIGDGRNDISLLRTSGYAVAMGNAAADVAREADAVTASNDEDGVVFALDAMIAARR